MNVAATPMYIVCRVFVAPIVFTSTLSFRECDIGSFVYGSVEVMNTFFAELFFCGYPFLLKQNFSRVRFLHRRVVRFCIISACAFFTPARCTFFYYLRVCIFTPARCTFLLLIPVRILRVCVCTPARCTYLLLFRLFRFNLSRVRSITGVIYIVS
jgi:hypothetical protein